MVVSGLEHTSVIEHCHHLKQLGAQWLRPSSVSQRNTQLSITSNNSTYQNPQLSPETRGLMPALSGPRQGHSSLGGVTAGAWGRGTRQTPLGQDWASHYLGCWWEEGGVLWLCHILPFISMSIHEYKHGGLCTLCEKKSRNQQWCRWGVFQAWDNGAPVIMFGPFSHCSRMGEFSLLDCALPINQHPL